jgi:putative transposase
MKDYPFHRRSTRLKDYNYTNSGSYFVAICVQNRLCLLGQIINETVSLSDYGMIVNECWRDIPSHFPDVIIDEYVIMPNHIHGILSITKHEERAGQRPAPTGQSLCQIIQRFKTFSAIRVNDRRKIIGPFWQRNYYEHIIRSEYNLNTIREYIISNPIQWNLDYDNPERTGESTLENILFRRTGHSVIKRTM